MNQESIIIGKVKDKEEALGIVNIALIGIDKLPDGEDDRSDAVKFVSLDFKNKTVKMTSFQHDVLIYTSEPRVDFHKMIMLIFYASPPLMLKILNYNYDLDVTSYVVFNSDTIKAIIGYRR